MTKKFILSCMAIGILTGGVCNNVSASQKGKMDPYNLQVVAGHMKTKDDLLNLTQLSSNKKFIVDKMRINTYSIKPEDLKLFSHIDTLRLETIDDIEAFLEYNPDAEYEKFLEGSNLRKNKGRFAKIEVTAEIKFVLAMRYLKTLKTLLRAWKPDLTKEKLNEEFKNGNVDFLKEIVKRYHLSNLTEEQLEEAVINQNTSFLNDILNKAEEIQEELVANKVKFFNVTSAAKKIGYVENGEFKFNDNVYSGNSKDVRNANKTLFVKSISGFRNIQNLKSIQIPNSVTSIGEYAFYGCTELTSIVIPDSVTSIEDSAFKRCTGLTSIVIPDSVKSIGDFAFVGCTGLTSIVIPDSVTSIGEWAFKECKGLNSITIPDSVTEIGYEAFLACENLNKVFVYSDIVKDLVINSESEIDPDIIEIIEKPTDTNSYQQTVEEQKLRMQALDEEIANLLANNPVTQERARIKREAEEGYGLELDNDSATFDATDIYERSRQAYETYKKDEEEIAKKMLRLAKIRESLAKKGGK